jgi:hypothetical protein
MSDEHHEHVLKRRGPATSCVAQRAEHDDSSTSPPRPPKERRSRTTSATVRVSGRLDPQREPLCARSPAASIAHVRPSTTASQDVGQ